MLCFKLIFWQILHYLLYIHIFFSPDLYTLIFFGEEPTNIVISSTPWHIDRYPKYMCTDVQKSGKSYGFPCYCVELQFF